MKTHLFLATAALLFAVPLAHAAEIDMSVVLTDPDGKPMTDCNKWVPQEPPLPAKCEQLVDLTLGGLAYTALNRPEQNLTTADQVKRGLLALRVKSAHVTELDASDIELIKGVIGKMGIPPVVVVTAYRLLDPASLKK